MAFSAITPSPLFFNCFASLYTHKDDLPCAQCKARGISFECEEALVDWDMLSHAHKSRESVRIHVALAWSIHHQCKAISGITAQSWIACLLYHVSSQLIKQKQMPCCLMAPVVDIATWAVSAGLWTTSSPSSLQEVTLLLPSAGIALGKQQRKEVLPPAMRRPRRRLTWKRDRLQRQSIPIPGNENLSVQEESRSSLRMLKSPSHLAQRRRKMTLWQVRALELEVHSPSSAKVCP